MQHGRRNSTTGASNIEDGWSLHVLSKGRENNKTSILLSLDLGRVYGCREQNPLVITLCPCNFAMRCQFVLSNPACAEDVREDMVQWTDTGRAKILWFTLKTCCDARFLFELFRAVLTFTHVFVVCT
eukprot:4227729-Amphidinium_carterae.1